MHTKVTRANNTVSNAWGNSVVVLWLGLWAFTAKGSDSIPSWETKILLAVQDGQKKPRKETHNKHLKFAKRIDLTHFHHTPTHSHIHRSYVR